MSEEAFLAALAAEPDDDLTRLAFADWLDDNGQPERAEAVRRERKSRGTASEDCLRFVPGRVEGLPGVTEVAVYPDRLEFLSAGKWIVFHLADIAEWPQPRWGWRLLARLRWRPRWLPVGERDWCRGPVVRVFRFFTSPQVVVYLPDETAVEYQKTIFRRVQDVLRRGGFSTWDMT
jgi:uncharacterized protein (TIGR02996 family)